jgi:hypothetical protein
LNCAVILFWFSSVNFARELHDFVLFKVPIPIMVVAKTTTALPAGALLPSQ